MKLFRLGTIPWMDTQLVYHSLARRGVECLVIHSADSPYLCVGFPHDPRTELDLDYLDEKGIGVFRREVGGGTVLLDGHQVFYHLILHRDNPLVPLTHEAFFRKLLAPVIGAYRDLGVDAEYRPINDLVAGGRKISGNGAGEIGDCKVLAGGIILDFNCGLMSRSLNLPEEGFRDMVREAMEESITSLARELDGAPEKSAVEGALIDNYGALLGELEPAVLDRETHEHMAAIQGEYYDEGYFFKRGIREYGRVVKVMEGRVCVHRTGGDRDDPVRVMMDVSEGRIRHADVRDGDIGDDNALGGALQDARTEPEELLNILNRFWTERGLSNDSGLEEELVKMLTWGNEAG